ncbi:Protoheme IX farnesyltransferase [bacterium HR11]|nr:Protoheme IX farnesyltransferase [bacterium HR11]
MGSPRVERRTRWGVYLKALRLDRWPRSLAVLPGWVLALVWHRRPWEGSALGALVGAYLATLGVSIFNYVLNEVTDAPYDAHHPVKRGRPVVQGRVSVGGLMGLGWVALGTGFLVGHWLSPYAWLPLLFLAIAGFLYNVPPRTKDVPYLDALTEAINQPIRFLIGWFSVVTWGWDWPSPWVLAAVWAFSAFLMYTKRLAEKLSLPEVQAVLYRRSLGAYSKGRLVACIVGSGIATLVALAGAALHLGRPRLWLLLPGVAVYALWIYRQATRHPYYSDEPEALFRRPVFLVLTGLLAVGALWALQQGT